MLPQAEAPGRLTPGFSGPSPARRGCTGCAGRCWCGCLGRTAPRASPAGSARNASRPAAVPGAASSGGAAGHSQTGSCGIAVTAETAERTPAAAARGTADTCAASPPKGSVPPPLPRCVQPKEHSLIEQGARAGSELAACTNARPDKRTAATAFWPRPLPSPGDPPLACPAQPCAGAAAFACSLRPVAATYAVPARFGRGISTFPIARKGREVSPALTDAFVCEGSDAAAAVVAACAGPSPLALLPPPTRAQPELTEMEHLATLRALLLALQVAQARIVLAGQAMSVVLRWIRDFPKALVAAPCSTVQVKRPRAASARVENCRRVSVH